MLPVFGRSNLTNLPKIEVSVVFSDRYIGTIDQSQRHFISFKKTFHTVEKSGGGGRGAIECLNLSSRIKLRFLINKKRTENPTVMDPTECCRNIVKGIRIYRHLRHVLRLSDSMNSCANLQDVTH